MREAYTNGLLVVAGIVLFCMLVQLLASVRMRERRWRELFFGLMLLGLPVYGYFARRAA